MTPFVVVLDVVVLALAIHTGLNTILLRRPPRGAQVDELVSVLMPMRDEAHRLEGSLRSVLGQVGLTRTETLVYDDDSTDGTAEQVRKIGGDQVRVVAGHTLPPGWLGKAHACMRLADAAKGSVLVFVDADVVLATDAVAGAVSLLRAQRLAFVSPYPRQLAGSWLERLVQPMLQWSWLTFLPLRLAERSTRPALAAANGQLLVADAAAYQAAGGHAAVRADVVEDMALARALVRAGGRGTFADGHDIATCRMYDGTRALVDGYAKSLWCAFGSVSGAVAVALLLLAVGVLPWALVAATPLAWPAAVAGPVSRLLAARRTGSRPAWDAIAHPLSVLAFAGLLAVSLARHHDGRLTWKSRPLP